MRCILAAVDLSAPSLRAAELADEIAGRFGAVLALVQVAEGIAKGDEVPREYLRIEHIQESAAVVVANAARAELEALRDRLRGSSGRTISCDVLFGEPAETIVGYAQRSHVDLIVTGHVGRGAFGRLLIGSVAKKVIDTAPCSVLVVH